MKEMEMEDSKQVAQIVIEMDEKGTVSLKAPMQNKIICYGMLKIAEEIISKTEIKKEQPLVVPVGNVLNLKLKPN